jgi:hypothetical protein
MQLKTANHRFEIEFNDTLTARAIQYNLPLKGKANIWGKEIYFSIPVHSEFENDARDILEPGELAFYPPMNAFCVFWGPTPASTNSSPRAADVVNIVGKIKGDLSLLDEVQYGEIIHIE